MDDFNRDKATEIADFANENIRKSGFNEILDSIKNNARKGGYAMRFHRNRLTKYDKEKLIERGFDVELEDTHFLVSWEKKEKED